MKTSRLFTAILLVASSAMAKAAVSHTVPGADGTSAPFIVGNVFDFWAEAQGRGGVGNGNVLRNTDPSFGANAASETPDHASSYTGRSGSSAVEKAPVANGAAAGPRGGFSGAGGAGGAGDSSKSSGAEAGPESADSTPAEGLKPLKNDTFLATVPSTIELPTGAAHEVAPAAGGALENPVDWNWANLHDRDKGAWKFTNRHGALAPQPAAEEKSEALITENPETRRGLSPKNQGDSNRKFLVVSAPEPAGALTMAGFLGLALFSRRRPATRL